MRINVTKSSMATYEEYITEIKDIWDNSWLTNMGPKHAKLEKKLCAFLGVPNVSLFTNGHLALETAIAFFDFPVGSEIITTPYTFVSTSNAIVRNGLVPIFCDIKEDDFTIDPEKIEALITKKTVAILPVHVYGKICDVDAIKKIAQKYNLKVIYDAAHAFGVSYNGKGCANFGDITMFSFHATKVFNTIEGGCLCFSDKKMYQKFNDLKNFGIHDEESCLYFGGNAKMSEFQAAMGICNLGHVNEWIKLRKERFEKYCERLKKVDGIIIPKIEEKQSYNYSYFPVLFLNYKFSRDQIKNKLLDHDIGSRKYFYPIVNQFDCYSKEQFTQNTPIAKMVSEHILTLPLYPDLPLEDIDLICDLILND